ncbi:MAG: hypothetical protein H6737_14185 [Alphaproteobacteria bacterium]|nr:hypothetical protein [Alphaproteobacteria bacterium]
MLALILTAHAYDYDGDGVENGDDLCWLEDDSVDLDNNGIADCSETMFWAWGTDDPPELAGWMSVWSYQFSQNDANGYVYSGSIDQPGLPNGTGMLQTKHCMLVDDFRSYTAAIQARALTKLPYQTSTLRFVVYEYTDIQCQNNLYGQNSWTTLNARGSLPHDSGWVTLRKDAYFPKPGVRAVRVGVNATLATDVAWVRADNLLFRPNPRIVTLDIDPVEEELDDPTGN